MTEKVGNIHIKTVTTLNFIIFSVARWSWTLPFDVITNSYTFHRLWIWIRTETFLRLSVLSFKACGECTEKVQFLKFLTTKIYQQSHITESTHNNVNNTSIAEVTASYYWKKENCTITISLSCHINIKRITGGTNKQHGNYWILCMSARWQHYPKLIQLAFQINAFIIRCKILFFTDKLR